MTILKILLSFLFAIFLLGFLASGREPIQNFRDQIRSYNSLGRPSSTVFNINNISSWQYHDGYSGRAPDGASGVIYPRSTAGVILQDGFIWGGILNNVIHVGGQTYLTGTIEGRILPGGIAEDPNLPHVRIYRIRRDYLTVSDNELRLDAAEINQIDPALVTQEMIDALRAQYAQDWLEWPVQSGAPFYDLNGNGIYEPGLGETPGLQNADMVIWFVCNDLDANRVFDLYGSTPIGLELQVTMWGYHHQGASWGQGAIRRYRMINKAGPQIDSMYISQYVEPDLGNFADDFAGCDSLLDLGYCYNGGPSDDQFAQFGIAPPAIGYCILQGPIVPGASSDTAIFNFKKIPGFRNLPMTSATIFSAGDAVLAHPPMGTYNGTLAWYNMLRGFLPSYDVNNPYPMVHRAGPSQGQPTKYPMNGDPVAGTGDIDGAGGNLPPGDRQMVICSGPFAMMPGDTQEVVIAMFGGLGDTYLQSITEMKQNMEFLRSRYGDPILTPQASHQIDHPTGTTTELQVQVNLQGFSNVIGSEISFTPDSVAEPPFMLSLFDDGMHNDSIAGDGIWGNFITQDNRKYPYNGDLMVNISSDQQTFSNIFYEIRLRPLPQLLNLQLTWENGQQDSSINYNELVHLAFDISNMDNLNDISGLRIENWGPAATSQTILYNNVISPGGTANGDSLFLEIKGASQGDSTIFSYVISFDGHREVLSVSYPLVAWNPNPIWGDTLAVQSIVGTEDNLFPIVADPLLLTGHTYRINFFEVSNSNLLWRLIDETIGSIILDNLEISSSPNYPHPVADGIQWQMHLPPLAVKEWSYTSGIPSPLYPNYSDGRWLSGVDWGGNALVGGLGMAHIFWGADPGVASDDFKPVEFRFAYMTAYDDLDSNGEYTLGWGPNGEGEPYYFNISEGQKAFMYETWGPGNYSGFFDIPFQVWDVDDPANPRQLNVIIRDRDQNTRWDIWHDGPPFNYIWVMADDYDPTGQAWDASTPDKDFMNILINGPGNGAVPAYYVLWAQQRGIRPFLAESGELVVIPYLHNAPGDILEVVSTTVGIDDQTLPLTFELMQNYPNPFNPTTKIEFSVAHPVDVKLEIFNVLGQKVRTIVNEKRNAGLHIISWNGRNEHGNQLGSGVFFYRLQAGDFVKTRKMVFLK